MRPRNSPYVWTTWITGLLAGTDKCYWRVWMKSHFYLPKKPETSEETERLKKWNAEHDEMTIRRAVILREEGYIVRMEEESAFTLKGATATLAGKPDIEAVKPNEKIMLVVDEKSGKAKDQYIWQVLIYMFAKSIVHKDYTISGEIEYKTDRVQIHPRQLNAQNKSRIAMVMTIMGGENEPQRVPSRYECGYCDILNCPDRYKEAEAIDATSIF